MYNPHVIFRSTERLEMLMGIPSRTTARISTMLRIHFPNAKFGASDRDFLLQLLFMELPIDLSIALEDGLYVKYNIHRNGSQYREPGNSGYSIVDIPTEMEKHFVSCIGNDGSPKNCTMEAGRQYVNCIDDCSLIRCPDNVSQATDCSNHTKGFERESCEAQIKWCQNYEIKTSLTGEELGYVPETGFCINVDGKPEQRDGYVLVDADTGKLGNCYYVDGVTKVNRTLRGDYGYCGGNGTNCDTTFYGGRSGTTSYNPRCTNWYQMTKLRQEELWSDPYELHETSGFGITYTHPLYRQEGTKNIFSGMLAVDYSLKAIHDYLHSEFSAGTVKILIVEEGEPYYVVSSSHGSPSTKLVSKSNSSQPCPDDNIESANVNTNCALVRIPIMEYDSARFDVIYQRSFFAQKALNFPSEELVSVTESTTVGSNAYISESYLFKPDNGGNLSWYVIAVMPMSRSTVDAAVPGDVAFTATCILALLGFIVCFSMFFMFYKKRKEKAMIQADWRFTCAFVMGCSILNLTSLTFLGEATDGMCLLRMWSFNFVFACALSPLYVKVWRMYTLLEASQSYQRVSITNFQAFLYALPIVFVEVILLVIFTFLDRPKAIEDLEVTDEGGLQIISCGQESKAFFICQSVFDACLLATGCYLAFRTRNLDPKFGEAKQLAFSMYNITFTGILIVLITNVVDMDQVSKIMLQAFGIVWGTILSCIAFVLPRLSTVVVIKNPIKLRGPGSGSSANYDHSSTMPNTTLTNLPNPSIGQTSAPLISGTNFRGADTQLSAGQSANSHEHVSGSEDPSDSYTDKVGGRLDVISEGFPITDGDVKG